MSDYAIRDHADLSLAYSELRTRYHDRDQRHARIYDVLNHDWDLRDSAGDPLDVASANMLKTALEDMSEAAATMPTVRVRPAKQTHIAQEQADRMTKIAVSYATANKIRTRMPRFIMDHLAYGLSAFVVLPHPDENRPIIYRRDARTCFPDMPVTPSLIPRRVMFAEQVAWASLSDYEKEMVLASGYQPQSKGVLVRVEHITDGQYVVGYAHGSNNSVYSNRDVVRYGPGWQSIVTESHDLKTDSTPAVIIARDTFDGQHRGLLDDVIDPQLAHAKLLAMAIDYADQAVYSDMWARDVLGDVAFGGGAFIELGPNGAIGRVPPASAGLDLWRDVEKLEEGIHLGARWPKSRPGQVDQAIASGKFVEATVGTMNTVLKVVHEKFAEGLEALLHLCFQTDLAYFPNTETTARGRIHGEDYMVPYIPRRDINMDHDVDVEYGLGLGRDSSESAVLMLQYAERELLSNEFVRENTEGLTDIGRERQRVDLEKVEKMMFAALLQGVEQGEYPKELLPEVYKRREQGESMVDILGDVFAPPEQEEMGEEEMAAMAAQGLPPGMPMPPGAGAEGALPPGVAPEVAPPAPPNPAQLLSRINVGPGGPQPTIGAQTMVRG